jgi:predicted metal-binding protein
VDAFRKEYAMMAFVPGAYTVVTCDDCGGRSVYVLGHEHARFEDVRNLVLCPRCMGIRVEAKEHSLKYRGLVVQSLCDSVSAMFLSPET